MRKMTSDILNAKYTHFIFNIVKKSSKTSNDYQSKNNVE